MAKKGPIATINAPGAPRATGNRAQPTTIRPPTFRPPKPRPLAPVPAAPAAPAGPTPLPVDPAYDAGVGAADATLANTTAGLTGARQRGLSDYGINETPTADPYSPSLAIDPNNPFGKAAVLKANYDIQRRKTGQQMGSGGQLYAGAYQNAQDAVNRGQLGEEDALQKSLIGFLAQNTDAQRQAPVDYQNTLSTLGADRLNRLPTNPLYNPLASEPAPTSKASTKPAAPPRLTPAQTAAKTAKDKADAAARKRRQHDLAVARARANRK